MLFWREQCYTGWQGWIIDSCFSACPGQNHPLKEAGKLEATIPFNHQQEVITAPLSASIFLEGPACSGKTTAGVKRMLRLVQSGIPAASILVMLPQRTLARPYYQALRNPDYPPGGLPSVLTIGGLAQRSVRLFWPAINQSVGFKRSYDPPIFLTLETAQYYMARIVQPLLEQGYFEQLVIDRNRLFSQILDNLNKSALVGFAYTEISERLKSAWIGKPAQLAIYDQVQECVNRFRSFCLENNLLDFSLQLEVFAQQLWPSHIVRSYLNNQFRYLIYDNIEEDAPVAHDIISEWLPDFNGSLLIYDQGGGYRAFLGADPDYACRLRDHCSQTITVDSGVVPSADLKQFSNSLAAAIRRDSTIPASASLRNAFTHNHQRFSTQMVDWVCQCINGLVSDEGVPAGEIVILSPFLSDSLRYALLNRLSEYGIPAYSHRPSRSLRDEPATQALLALAKLAYSTWELDCKQDEVRSALSQSIQGMDLVRADLLTRIVFKPGMEDGPLLPFEPLRAEVRERISYALGERYTRLRDWLMSCRGSPLPELDIFIARLFGEVLSQPGFGFHSNFEAASITARLIESVQKFRQVTVATTTGDVSQEYVRMVQQGILAAQYLQAWENEPTNAVFLAPAYTYLISNRPVRIQFWLDAGGMGWWERLYQPLTHPRVLSRGWQPGRSWTDQDEVQTNQDNLVRLTGGLIQRCREHIYLCSMKINERGSEERGPLLQAVQSILRRMPAADAEGGHV